MLKIGITCGFLYPEKNRKIYNAKTLSYVENETIEYIARAGCFPVVIPNLNDELLIPILDEIDAFILHGGSDVAPESYGETPIGEWLGDKYRDKYELEIIDYAFKHNKPVMGICRGCQILNVYFGGTLYQDISTQTKSPVVHSDPVKYDMNFHKIQFTGNNFLRNLYYGVQEGNVNSIHHQSVKDLGKDLKPLCVSPDDDIIEAFYYAGDNKGLYLGIQWHPEFIDSANKRLLNAKILLDYFLKSIK